MIYWTARLIKRKRWQARKSEKLRFLKLNFLKRPISEGSTSFFDSPYRLGSKAEDRGDLFSPQEIRKLRHRQPIKWR